MAFFKSLYGNDALKKHLSSALESGTLAHAYIVEGNAGSGRKTLARLVSAALSCEGLTEDTPCGVCPHCKRILSGNSPDVQLFTRNGEATFKIDAVRAIRRDIYMAPTENSYKVYILEDADTMTVQAQNALLKVLEEPPTSAVMFLLVTRADRLLPTVRSRAQILKMERFTNEALRSYLTRENADAASLASREPDAFLYALRAAGGSIGGACAALSPEWRAENQKKREVIDAVLASLPERNALPLYRAIFALPQKRQELSPMLLLLSEALRDLTLLKKSEESELLYFKDAESASALSMRISVKSAVSAYDAVCRTLADLDTNANVNSLLTALLGALMSGRKG